MAAVRLLVAVLVVVAVVGQWVVSLGSPVYRPENFFGYFTIQSNLVGAAVAVVAAVLLLRRADVPGWSVLLRAAATTYLLTTGVVYNTLLVDATLAGSFTVPWSNDLLHRWVPALVVLDWLLVGDRRPLRWRWWPVLLAYPLVWLVVVLARGASFVPYPFLDVERLGAGVVALWCLAIAVGIGLAAALVVGWSRADRAVVLGHGAGGRVRAAERPQRSGS